MWSTSSRVWEDGSLFDGGAYGDAPGSRHKKSGSGEAATAAAPDKQTLWLGVREHLHEILLDRATGWRLYLGSFVASEDRAVLSNHGIMSIVNVSRSERNFFEADAEFEYLRLPYDDHSDAPLHRSFDEAMAFIDRARLRGASVLVHCRAGVSRSATVVLAYLVQREKRSLRHAFLYLKAIRSVVDPNPGFWQQLVELERKVHGATSVRLLQSPEHGLLPCIYLDHSAMRSLRVGTASFDESGVGDDDDYDDAEASNYDNEDEREQDQWCLDVEQSATRSFSSMPTVMPVGEQPSTHSGALDDLLASVYNVHEQSRRRRRCEEDDTDHEGAGTDGGSSCIVS